MKTLLLLLLILLTSCNGQSGKGEKERIITVTIEPQRYFVESIAGNKFKVITLVPKGSSPETYDPTPRQLVALSKSEAYMRIGQIGFEVAWMEKIRENAPHLRIFDNSTGIELISTGEYAHGDHVHAGGVDPHIWNSVLNTRIIARNICQALCELDKPNEEYYIERYNKFSQELCEISEQIAELLSEGSDHAFLIFHPALTYFAHDYGLRQYAIEEGGKEPSPAHLKRIIEICEEEKIRIIFIQPEFDRRNAEVIAKQTGIRIIPINPLSYNWKQEMMHIAESLQHEDE